MIFTQNELEDSINLAMDADLAFYNARAKVLRIRTTIEGIEFVRKIEPLILPF